MSQISGDQNDARTVTYRDALSGQDRKEVFSTSAAAQRRGRELGRTSAFSDIQVGGAKPEPLNAGAGQWLRYKEFEEGYRS